MRLILGALLFASASAMAIGWDKYEGVGKIEKKGVISVGADWVKDKNDKFDVSLKLTNESKNTILIFTGDMTCSRGADESGHIDPHADRRTLELRPDETRSVIVTCRLATKNKGDYAITIKSVFDNPSGDSNTPGKALAGKLVWKQGQTEGKKL